MSSLPSFCLSKVFWSAIGASFAFTLIMFNVAIAASGVNADEISKRASNIYVIPELKEDISEIKQDIKVIKCVITEVCI